MAGQKVGPESSRPGEGKKTNKKRFIIFLLLGIVLFIFAGAGLLAAMVKLQKEEASDYPVEASVFDEGLDVNKDSYITGDELDNWTREISTVTAETPPGDKVALIQEAPSFYSPKLFVRAKLEYRSGGGLKGLDDSMIRFNNKKWKKGDDGWYYYESKVDPGTKLPFFESVKIPCDWDNGTADKRFDIIVTAQCSEAFDGGPGNDQQAYIFTDSIFHNVSTMEKNNQVIEVVEYQKEEDGDLVPYVNDKTVVPCEVVSKIAVIDVKKFVVEDGVPYLEYQRNLEQDPVYDVLEPLTPLAKLLEPVADPLTPVAKIMGDAPVTFWYILGGGLAVCYGIFLLICRAADRRKIKKGAGD